MQTNASTVATFQISLYINYLVSHYKNKNNSWVGQINVCRYGCLFILVPYASLLKDTVLIHSEWRLKEES